MDLSVQIVQQINSQPEHSQTIETNVTVSSTLKSLHGNGNANSPHLQTGGQGSTSIRTSTSVECKQEPSEDNPCLELQGGHSGFTSDFDDDLQALLETLEKDGDLSEDIINDLVKLDKFDEVCFKSSRDAKDPVTNDPMNVLSPAPPKGTSPAVQAGQPSSTASMSQMYDVNQNMDGLQSTVPMGQFRPNSQSQMSGLAETGPAAETLKQMAAHHQNQQPPPAYVSLKSSPMSPYSEPLQEDRYIQHRNGYANFQQQGFSGMSQQNAQNSGMYPYNQQVGSHVPVTQQVQSKDNHLSYGGTKPLSHFPNPIAAQVGQPPSSLQQLQNQVRAQFSSAPTQQMQMSQSQQMQISQGHHRMQMSQSQQMQMQQPPHQFSMSQQQSFTMSSNMTQNQSQFVGDPVKMQMYQEKMRQEQQQQQQQQQLLEQQRRAQMHQYMNRPPPEYKMQGNPGNSGFQVNGMGPSPLQTMQNMVNQTNTLPGGYSQVKSEVGTMNPQGQGVQTGAVPGVQAMGTQGVPGSQGIHPDMVSNNSSSMDNYAAQQMQRQMFKQSQMAAVAQNPSAIGVGRAPRPAAPTYSSTIMRNQRPPNVNVGPEGLNISQPRNPAEWTRPMLGPAGQRHPGPQQGQMGRPTAPGNMMPAYAAYSNTASGMQMQQQRTGQISAMQGQSVVMQSSAQAMMQQRMQMSQQMALRQNMVATSQSATPPYSVNSSGAMATPSHHPTHTQNTHPQNSFPSAVPTTQSDFSLDFLDSTQSANSDFFDSMVQNTNSSDFAILEEILGK